MTISLENYKNFLSEFLKLAAPLISEENFNHLKNKYESEINSKRTFEKIDNLGALIKCLEKRALIQYDRIEIIKSIEDQFIKQKSTKNLISKYQLWLEENSSQIENLYKTGKPIELQSNNLYKSVSISDLQKCLLNYKTEENCLETFQQESQSIYVHNLQTSHSNTFSSNTIETISKKFEKITCTKLIIIILFFLIPLLYIWIFDNMFHKAAILKENPVLETSNLSGSSMPYYTSNAFSSETRFTNPVVPYDKDKNLQDLVINKVSRKIGSYWRDVMRKLDIEESIIDKLDSDHYREPNGDEVKFKKAMKIYFEDHHPRWKFEFKKALEMSRRKDLKELVEEILDSH